MGRIVKRGEVRWYKFHTPNKKRPVVVLSRNSVLEYLGEVTVAPVTGTIRDIPSEVLLTQEDGVPKNCAVNCDHLQTVAKSKLGALLAVLSADKLAQVSKAVRFALDV